MSQRVSQAPSPGPYLPRSPAFPAVTQLSHLSPHPHITESFQVHLLNSSAPSVPLHLPGTHQGGPQPIPPSPGQCDSPSLGSLPAEWPPFAYHPLLRPIHGDIVSQEQVPGPACSSTPSLSRLYTAGTGNDTPTPPTPPCSSQMLFRPLLSFRPLPQPGVSPPLPHAPRSDRLLRRSSGLPPPGGLPRRQGPLGPAGVPHSPLHKADRRPVLSSPPRYSLFFKTICYALTRGSTYLFFFFLTFFIPFWGDKIHIT